MNSVACVIIHGFGGSLSEITYLEEYLKNKNIFDVYSILLPGHGGTKKDLSKTNRRDWINSVKIQIDELKHKYSNIIVIGFSMGGLIGSQLAAENLIDKLILINTPYKFWNVPVILRDAVNLDIGRYTEAVSKTSIKSCFDFLGILGDTKNILYKVKCPTLIIQCSKDETVPPKSALKIKRRISGQVVLKKYTGGRHRVFMEKEGVNLRDEICRDIVKWVLQES